MKNAYLLSAMIVLTTTGINAMYPKVITAQQAHAIKMVLDKKLAMQKALARPSVYKMLDTLVVGKNKLDWPAVFAILDRMQGVIGVNEYSTPVDDNGRLLLDIACEDRNLLVAKTLLEKYKADPNRGDMTALMIACAEGDMPVVKLLLQYGGNPSKKASNGMTSSDFAANQPEVLKILKQ